MHKNQLQTQSKVNSFLGGAGGSFHRECWGWILGGSCCCHCSVYCCFSHKFTGRMLIEPEISSKSVYRLAPSWRESWGEDRVKKNRSFNEVQIHWLSPSDNQGDFKGRRLTLYSWPKLVELALLVVLTSCLLIKSTKQCFPMHFY